MMKPFAALLAAATISAPLAAVPLSSASADTWRQVTIERRGPPAPVYRPHAQYRHHHRHYVMPQPPRHHWAERDAWRGGPAYNGYYYR